MEPVNDAACEVSRERLAMRAFGDLSPEETRGLEAHLEGCGACRDLARELADTVAMLQYVDQTAVEPTAHVPAALSARVLGDLQLAGRHERRRRRAGVAVLALVGAAACALVLAVVLSSSTTAPRTRTLALKGRASVSASAELVGEPWGTSLTLSEKGLPGGEVYTVSMETATGAWWTAGTYRSVAGGEVRATMSCAVSLSRITGLRVVNDKGATVLSSFTSTNATYN